LSSIARKHRKIFPAAATILSGMTEPHAASGTSGQVVGPIDWAATLAEHDRRLRIAVGVRLGEPQAVDEVMQEIALAAIEQRAPLSEASKVGAWLHRLAIRKTLLYRRRCGRQSKLFDRVAMRKRVEYEPASANPLSWLLRDERRQRVRDALQQLPSRDKEILLLKYTEDWSYRRLAEHLGVPESAVVSRLHRARARLRHALAGDRDYEVSP
jgi:RNA polymerase sigma-70 factor (ECF subfamily)